MIIFNEGLPGAGKSYDAVSAHILPALKSGRHVYARLNGLNFYAIAQHLNIPEDRVRELLHLVTSDEVHRLFVITKPKDATGDGDMALPAIHRDSLIVIDEAHEFYVSSREELPIERENFFAKSRHFGLDILLISQWFKRMHSAVRGRVERKHLFRKLGFIKALRNKRAGDTYVCRQQICMEPDKFAVLSSEERSYDKSIFYLYHGIQPGTVNTVAYDPGFQGLFSRKQKFIFGFVIVLVIFAGIRSYLGYNELTAPKHERVYESKKNPTAPQTQATYATRPQNTASPVAVPLPTGTTSVGPIQKVDLPPTVQYVLDLGKNARPRLAALYNGQKGKLGVVQWHTNRTHVTEVLDTRKLEQMGWAITFNQDWIEMHAHDQVIIVTAWPLEDGFAASTKQIRASAGL